MDYGVEEKFYHYRLVDSLLHSKRMLEQDHDKKDGDFKKYRRQLNYLRGQIVWHYIKNIFYFPFWLIKILSPSFLRGTPNIWTNIKLIATRKEFHPLRMAMISWLVFTYLIIQGGVFFFQRDLELVRAETYNWVQTGWTASSSVTAVHADRTGWTNYWDIYPTNVVTTTGSEITLKAVASSTVQTTTGDFGQGTVSDTAVGTNAVNLSAGSAIATNGISAGVDHSCALKENGAVYCWGDNAEGQLGNNNAVTDSDTPVQVVGVGGTGTLANITYIGQGGATNHSCAVNTSDNVFCWGSNTDGQLGDQNEPTASDTPVQVVGVGGSGFLGSVSSTSNGNDFSCALTTGGAVYCWGDGENLGINSYDDSISPAQVLGVGGVGTLSGIIEIASGANHTCALNISRNVYCWGRGNEGEMGNGGFVSQLAPVQVSAVGGGGTLDNIVNVTAGSDSVCAVNTSGSTFCWGSNAAGQLGDGTVTNRNTPVQVLGVFKVGNLADVIEVSAGSLHTCAVNTSNNVYCWGDNTNGALGDNTTTPTTTPVQVLGVGGSGFLEGITPLSGGGYHTCAINSSDAVYCWGDNESGQLGDNNAPIDVSTPVQVVGVSGTGTLSLGTAYNSSGTFTSNIIDTSSSTAWNTIVWTTSTLANTSVTMKVRTGQRSDMGDATAWTSCDVIDNTGNDISSNNCVTDGHRYIQYQTALATNDTGITSELRDVTINYTRYTDVEQTITSNPFNTGDSTNFLSSIGWTENLPNSNTNIKFQIRTSADGTTWGDWLGPTGVGDYYTDPAGGETINLTHTDGAGDQYLQYKIYISSSDGENTPTLSDVTLTYVINQEPQISGSGVTATQLSNGHVSINWGAKDTDTGTATSSFEYSLNNGSSWSNILGHLSTGATTTRSISSWTTTTVIWQARDEIDGQDVSQMKIRVTEDDGELANNTVSSTSGAFAFDVADPTVSTPAIWVVATTSPATVYHTVADTNSIEMATSLDSAMSGASWVASALTSTVTLGSDPDTVYTQYRDSFSNTTTIQSATTPETPTGLMIKDISNPTSGDYKEFIVWTTVALPTPGFSRYDIYRSTDGVTYSYLASESTRTNNYYLDQTVSANTTYYYKVATVDSYKSTSNFSSVVSDNADGQGGTDVTAPTISNIAESDITTQSFTITWDTNEVSSSSVAYSASAFGPTFTTTTVDTMVKSAGSSLGGHSVTVTGLTPGVTYYYQVASADPDGNTEIDSGGGAYSIATTDGPTISGVSVESALNNQATITWNTNVSSDSTVYYSTNSNLSGSSNETSATPVTEHSITITGLTQGTRYYFYVTSGVATDTNGGDYYTFTTTADTTAPTISSVTASPVADTTAVITWTTNEGATSQMMYGTTSGGLDNYSTLATGLNLSHTVSLTGLTVNTTYYFTVSSVDGSDNATTSSQSSFTTLETLSEESEVVVRETAAEAEGLAGAPGGGGGFPYVEVDNIPPTISSIRATDINSDSAVIQWTTNESGDSAIQFGKTTEYTGVLVDFDRFVTNHSLEINNLIPSTIYNYRVTSIDESGNRAYSANQTFTALSGFEELDELQDFQDALETPEEGSPESVFKSLIDKTADIIRRMSGQISTEALELGLATQYSTIAELGKLVPIPLISGQPVVEAGSTYARIFWTTDKLANSLVAIAPDTTYQNNQEYVQVVGNADEQVENHEVLISELKSNTLYHYQVRSKTPVSDTAMSRDFLFTTRDEQLEIITYKVNSKSDTEAVWSWTTNAPTDSRVVYIPYGADGILMIDSARSAYDKAVTALHEVVTEDMESGLTYQVELSGEDLNGNIVSKTISTFSTSEVDAPPVITQVQTDAALLPGDQTAVQAILSWVTNEPSTSQIFYQRGFGVTEDQVEFNQKTPLDPNYVKRHILVITNFDPGAVYQFQVESVDSSGNITRSRTYTLLTPRQKESVFQVIMSNLEETFGWVGQLGL